MTSSQYNNIIQGTLGTLPDSKSKDSVQVARAIMNNCGVALPTGNCTDILRTLISGYMGWKSCTKSEAQGYANAGIAAIGMDANRMLVVAPKEETIVVDSAMEVPEEASVYARTVSGISTDEQMTLQYFAYAGEDTTTVYPAHSPTPHGNYETYNCGTLAVCTDGVGEAHNDKYHQNSTAYMGGKLNADVHRYIVIPTNHPNYASLLGCVGVVIDNRTQKYLFAVIGEGGLPTHPISVSEVSISTVEDLEYETDGSYGPSQNEGFTIIIFTDTKRTSWPVDTLNRDVAIEGAKHYY